MLGKLLIQGVIVRKRKISKRDALFFVCQYLYIEIKVNGKLLDDLFQLIFIEDITVFQTLSQDKDKTDPMTSSETSQLMTRQQLKTILYTTKRVMQKLINIY